jgi:DNA polymerase III subunit gamma/tau
MTGQEHITRTLRNALKSEQLAHAYLFCGPRGTGKTTTAKILARAMNCEHFPVPEPCGKCVPCRNIAAGVSIDVIEMDAASNRGIDEIRELRERSRFASGESRYKVYIIDEAHMLTPEACNAFLKTLEEPPQNVVFILATTDPSRLPSTIVSRCQRFDFHLLNVEQIRQRLEEILVQEGWEAETEAVGLIARLADGSLRDALGILEQCAAYGEEKITEEQVRTVTGATRVETTEALVRAAVENDFDSGLSVLGSVVFSGRDLGLFIRDFTFIFTRFLLDERSGDKGVAADRHGFEEIVARYHGKLEQNIILDAVELLHEAGGELRNAHFPQYVLEIAFIRLLRILHGRVKPAEFNIERSAQAEETSPAPPAESSKPLTSPGVEKSGETPKMAAENPEPLPGTDRNGEQLAKLKESWPRLLQEIKRKQKSTAAWLEPAELASFQGHLVRLDYTREYSIHQMRIMEDSHRSIVEDVISAFCREAVRIKADLVDGPGSVTVPEREATDRANPAAPNPAKNVEKKKGSTAEDAMKLFGGKLINTD